ncbi:MAG: hypothetical protein WAW88_06395 [Nocardioides sp.]
MTDPTEPNPTPDTTPDLEALEAAMRRGLHLNADEIEAAPILTPAGQRRRRWQPLAAAAAVIAVAVGGAAMRWTGQTPDRPDPTPGAPNSAASADEGYAGWRLESYAGVQLRVPESWGWGGAPTSTGFGATGDEAVLDCAGKHAYVVPGSTKYEFEPKDTPFVGRPDFMTDMCVGSTIDLETSVDYVWLGSFAPLGVRELDGGFTAETVDVGGQRVTVTTRDPDLRDQIIASAAAVDTDDNGCAARLAQRVQASGTGSKAGFPDSLSVCAYRFGSKKGNGYLMWSQRIDGAAVAAYVTAVDHHSALYDPFGECSDPSQQLVVLRWGLGREWATTDVISTGSDCRQIAFGVPRGALLAPVNPETMGPLRSGWLRAYVPAGPDDLRLFKPMMG